MTDTARRRASATTPSAHRPPGWSKRLAALALAGALTLGGATVAAADPIDGGASIGDSLFAGIGNTGYDVVHYDVELHYAHEATDDREAGSIVATTTITARRCAPSRSTSRGCRSTGSR